MKENMDGSTLLAWIDKFYHRAKVMREIQSGKAQSNRFMDTSHTVTILVTGAVITFLGFFGTDRLASLVDGGTTATWKALFDFAYNLAVLFLFVASLLNLVYRWKEDFERCFSGVKRLTQYLHWLDELKLRVEANNPCWIAKEVRMKYQVIVEQMPPNSERQHRKAIERLNVKKAAKDGSPASGGKP